MTPPPVVAPRTGRAPPPLDEALQRMHLGPSGPDVAQTLRGVSAGPAVLQEYRPLYRTLEWELSELEWATRGVLLFAHGEVPFAVNNSGRLSEHAAAVLFANCLEADDGGPIGVLELGAGTGLFAHHFLNAFRAICTQEGRDYYDRLVYVVSDRSSVAVQQWTERRLFVEHARQVVAGTCDACDPRAFRPAEGTTALPERLRAAFCNYVLDVLPATVIRHGERGCEELHIRTQLTNDHRLISQYTPMGKAEIHALAAAANAAPRTQLIPLLSLMEFEAAFRPCPDGLPPYASDAVQLCGGPAPILLNHGAMACLDACLALLEDTGFILINDYGPTRPEEVADQAVSQRFGATSAIGLNFPLLERLCTLRGAMVVAPHDDERRAVHARLVVRHPSPQTAAAFQHRFGGDAYRHFEGPLEEARQHAAAGRNNEALDSYRLALERSPRDWYVIGEIAEYVGLHLQQFAAGLELARSAVALNPWYSPWLWNVLGDCLFCFERFADAHQAYLQAQCIDPRDVRTNLNLAYTHAHFGAYREALDAIALALAHDERGLYRTRLLDKQQQIVSALSARWVEEQERLTRRATRLRAAQEPPSPAS